MLKLLNMLLVNNCSVLCSFPGTMVFVAIQISSPRHYDEYKESRTCTGWEEIAELFHR